MVRFVIGDYKISADDCVIDNYYPSCIFKTILGEKKSIVIFAEFTGITALDCKAIAKAATANVTVVLQSNKLLNGIRQSKSVQIEYVDGSDGSTSVFEVGNALIKVADRDYLFNFLKINKPQMFMLIKVLIGGFDKLSKANREVVAWLDMYQWKVNPEILFAIMAYKLKHQANVYRLPWKFPKKVKDTE